MKQAIFNADDFGFSEKVNLGIVHCFKHGIITDSSVIMTMPSARHAMQLIKKNHLKAGVHLTLNDGLPLCKGEKKSTISRNGKFLKFSSLFIRLLSGNVEKEHIKGEFRAQIENFKKYNARISHFDSHKYIHMFPPVFMAVAELANEYGVKAVRVSDETTPLQIKKIRLNEINMQLLKCFFVSKTSRGTRKLLPRYGLISTDHFFGIARTNAKNTENSFIKLISSLPQGTSEIMCHPGYNDPSLSNITSYTFQREQELEALCSPSVKAALKASRVKLISFKDLNRPVNT